MWNKSYLHANARNHNKQLGRDAQSQPPSQNVSMYGINSIYGKGYGCRPLKGLWPQNRLQAKAGKYIYSLKLVLQPVKGAQLLCELSTVQHYSIYCLCLVTSDQFSMNHSLARIHIPWHAGEKFMDTYLETFCLPVKLIL